MCGKSVLLAVVVFLSLVGAGGPVHAADPNLIGWWRFDETSGTTAADSSGNGLDGTLVGQPQWVAGKTEGALLFDGVDDMVEVAYDPALDLGQALTIAAWLKLQNLSTYYFIAVKAPSGSAPDNYGGNYEFRTAPTTGVLEFLHQTSESTNFSSYPSTGRLTAGRWYHVAVTIVKGGSVKFYIDGVSAGTATQAGAFGLLNQEPLRLAGRKDSYSFFNGLLDEVQIYNRALKDAEIKQLAARPKAYDPQPADGATGVTMPLLQWTAATFATAHAVYFGTSPDLTAANLVVPRQTATMFYYGPGLQPGVSYWWRVDETLAGGAVQTGDLWAFTAAPASAYAPLPRSGDKWIATDVVLTWQPGFGAYTHEVYFGTDKDAVTNRDASTFKVKQPVASYAPGTLEQNTIYYWAVDESPGGDIKHPGALWSFTTTGPGGGIRGEYFNGMTLTGKPLLSRLDAAIDFAWGTEAPGASLNADQFSVRWTADFEIAVADTYTFSTNTDDGVRLWLNDRLLINRWVDQGPTDVFSDPIALEPGFYPLRMEYYENTSGAVAHLFWQTPALPRQIIPAGPLQPPVRARVVYPAHGSVDIPQDLTLVWSAGEAATGHQVYFGDDAAAVAAADTSSSLYKGLQALDETSFSPGALEWNQSYSWRVDEVNEARAESPWKGPVWSFTTADFLVVDDMERYTDEEGANSRIYETWIDGYSDSSSGSTVGNLEPPFAEQTIVHGGRQSMPMDYNNINTPYYSEAYREFSPAQNWTVNGVTDLVLWLRGWPAPTTVSGTGDQLTVSGSGTDIWSNSDQFTFVFKTLSGDGSISARVVSNGTGSSRWAKGGVMVRDSLEPGSTHAMMVLTGGDGNGASFQYRLITDDVSANADAAAAIAPPYYVKIERTGDSLAGYLSVDGKNWTPQGTPQYIAMTSPAYIGIAVTSHAAGAYRTFEFDNIKTSGAGAWQTKEIGLLRNSPQPLYVIVEDSSNKRATVVDPNAAVVNAATWTEWKIPLSDLKGVNLTKVKKLYIGVGDKANPASDGTGRIYIDDIRVVKPTQ